MTTAVDTILDEVANLSIEEQELIDEVIHKRLIEGKRKEMYADYQAALAERKQGRIKSGSVAELFGNF